MTRTNNLFFALFLLVALSLAYYQVSEIGAGSTTEEDSWQTSQETHVKKHTQQRNPSSPIIIESDLEFLNYEFEGDGEPDTPYIIEDLEIIDPNAQYGISIYGTTKHFVIRNCYIEVPGFPFFGGIVVENVASGSANISNNVIQLTYQGTAGVRVSSIMIDTAHYAIVEDNLILGESSQWVYGIHLDGTDNSTITNNTVKDIVEGSGIRLSSSHNATVANNTCLRNSGYGIWLDFSHNGTVIANNLTENDFFGISLESSDRCWVSENNITNNGNPSFGTGGGIFLDDADKNNVNRNTIDYKNVAWKNT